MAKYIKKNTKLAARKEENNVYIDKLSKRANPKWEKGDAPELIVEKFSKANYLSKRSAKMCLSKIAGVKSDKPAYKEKIKTDNGYVWKYDEKHIEKRWKLKKEKIQNLEKNLARVRKEYEKDLASDDARTRAIAAVVGVMDDTAMRIGNEESARDAGTFGATTLKVKHVTFKGNKAHFKFPGKGDVDQDTTVENSKVVKVLKELVKGKKKDDFIFEVDGKKIWDRAVNRYLTKFDISAKDIRGFHSNKIMKEKLKTKDWDDALEEVADLVGHKPSTLKNQYLMPELVEKYEKKASLSIRAQDLPVGSLPANEEDSINNTITTTDSGKEKMLAADPNRNISNIDRKKVRTKNFFDLERAWRFLAPFLPDGSFVTSGFRDDGKQAQTILEFWLSKWWDRPDKYNSGFFQTTFGAQHGIDSSVLRSIHSKAVRDAQLSRRDLALVEKIRTIMVSFSGAPRGSGGPQGPLDLAQVGKSAHQYGTALDISGPNLQGIKDAVLYVSGVFPNNIQIANIIDEPENNAIHIELGRRVVMPDMNKYLEVLKHYQNNTQMAKYQEHIPRLSKRAELTPEDSSWLSSIKQDSGPMSMTRPQLGNQPNMKAQMGIRPGVKLNDLILSAWQTLKPFLSKSAVLTSGLRSPQDQIRILNNYWVKATGKNLPPGVDYDEVSKRLKDFGYIVGPPWTKSQYAHLKGTAMDVSGAPLDEIAAAVKMVSNDQRLPVRFRPPLVEWGNRNVHIGIESARYDAVAVAEVLREKGYRMASISKLDAEEKNDMDIHSIYEDLVLSGAPNAVVEEFEDAFKIKSAASFVDEMGLGLDDMPGDWFEKAPMFRWRTEDDALDSEIHDLSESEANTLCKEDPEKFFYRGLHKKYPSLEHVALENLIEKNAKFFFVFKYHERDEEAFKNMLERAAELLSQQDARAFFYYHLHHRFPELGRGAIIQLIDTNPDSFFDLGLQKDYPDYEESAGAARNIKDPNKVELEIPEWLESEPEKPISLRDRNACKISKRAGDVIMFSPISRKVIETLKNLPGSFEIQEGAPTEHMSGEIPIRDVPNISVLWNYMYSEESEKAYIKVLLSIKSRGFGDHKTIYYYEDKDQVSALHALRGFLNNIGEKAVSIARKEHPEAFEAEKTENVIPMFKNRLSSRNQISGSKLFKEADENPSIDLTDKEQKIFDILLETIKWAKLGSTIRVAGGWVRDKIMGKDSKDIDIAIDNMPGRKFAEHVMQYANMQGVPVKSVGVVEARPEQSKHLETAVMNILGQDIDFVNLRAERYDPDSRIPKAVTGTAIEDAYRRDFTINAIFYNINDGKVEDLTGKGLEDIKNGIIRTPIPSESVWKEIGINSIDEAITPKKTFMDDPLRVLRAIRFASRYGFELAPELIDAAKDKEVQEAFAKKISRERMEIELRKMLGGPDPVRAMQLIKEVQLRSEVLRLPEQYAEWEMDQNSPHHQLSVWDHTLETLTNIQKIVQDRNLNEADKFVLNLAALLHDAGKLNPEVHGAKEIEGKISTTYHGHEEVSMRAAEYLLRNLPGIRVEEIERVKNLIDGARRVNPQRQQTDQACQMSRKALGKFVQKIGNDWEHAIDLALADTAAHKKDWISTLDRTYYDTMKEQVKGMGLEKAHETKPLLNGFEVMQTIGRKKGGKWLGELNKSLVDWQFENPQATKEDAVKFIQQQYIDMGLDKIARHISKRANVAIPPHRATEEQIINMYSQEPRQWFEYYDEIKSKLNEDIDFLKISNRLIDKLLVTNPDLYFSTIIGERSELRTADRDMKAAEYLSILNPNRFITLGLHLQPDFFQFGKSIAKQYADFSTIEMFNNYFLQGFHKIKEYMEYTKNLANKIADQISREEPSASFGSGGEYHFETPTRAYFIIYRLDKIPELSDVTKKAVHNLVNNPSVYFDERMDKDEALRPYARLAAQKLLEKNPREYLSLGLNKEQETKVDLKNASLFNSLRDRFRLQSNPENDNFVSLTDSNFQYGQRHPETGNLKLYDFAINNPVAYEENDLEQKVLSSLHHQVGVTEGRMHQVGLPGFTKSWALVSFPSNDMLVIEEIQSDLPQALRYITQSYDLTKERGGNRTSVSERLKEQYGTENYKKFMRNSSVHALIYPYMIIKDIANFAQDNEIHTIKLSNPNAIFAMAPGISEAKVNRIYNTIPTQLGFKHAKGFRDSRGFMEYSGNMATLARAADALAQAELESKSENKKSISPREEKTRRLDVDALLPELKKILGDKISKVDLSGDVALLMRSLQELKRSGEITSKDLKLISSMINKFVIASEFDDLIIKIAELEGINLDDSAQTPYLSKRAPFFVAGIEKEEANKYEKEKDDPKWDETLIDNDKKWTRRQIREHYIKNKSKIMKEIKGRPVMLFIGTGKNESVLKRNHNDKKIVIENDADYAYWADRRMISIHRVFGPKTDLGFVDLDVHGNFPQDKVRAYAKKVSAKIKSKYGSSSTIYDSGGTGYHVEFHTKEKDVDTLRNELRELCEDLNEESEGFTTGIVKGEGVRTDTTTLKNLGNIRVPYALHEKYGGVKKPIGVDSADDYQFMRLSFRQEAGKKHKSAGIFMVLPDKLAKQFKSLGEHDDSKPHVTVLFIGDVKKDKYDVLENTVKGVLKDKKPFELELDSKVTYFDATKHSDDCKIAKIKVLSKGLHKLHDDLKKAISEAGIEIDDHFPKYSPHITLEYMDPPKEKYDGEVPSGSWTAEEVEIWGTGSNKPIELKLAMRQLSTRTAERAEKQWWMSPSSELHYAPNGHIRFIQNNPGLFGNENASEASYESAFEKGWTRIAKMFDFITFTVPGVFSDSDLHRIQRALMDLPDSKTAIVVDNSNVVEMPYSLLAGAQSVGEIKRRRREASNRQISKRAGAPYGWWLSPNAELHPVKFFGHEEFIEKNRGIFGKRAPCDDSLYDLAYRKGWIRIMYEHENIFVQVPSFDNKNLETIKRVYPSFPKLKGIEISGPGEPMVLGPFAPVDFLTAKSFGELKRISFLAAYYVSNAISKRASSIEIPPKMLEQAIGIIESSVSRTFSKKTPFTVAGPFPININLEGSKYRNLNWFSGAARSIEFSMKPAQLYIRDAEREHGSIHGDNDAIIDIYAPIESFRRAYVDAANAPNGRKARQGLANNVIDMLTAVVKHELTHLMQAFMSAAFQTSMPSAKEKEIGVPRFYNKETHRQYDSSKERLPESAEELEKMDPEIVSDMFKRHTLSDVEFLPTLSNLRHEVASIVSSTLITVDDLAAVKESFPDVEYVRFSGMSGLPEHVQKWLIRDKVEELLQTRHGRLLEILRENDQFKYKKMMKELGKTYHEEFQKRFGKKEKPISSRTSPAKKKKTRKKLSSRNDEAKDPLSTYKNKRKFDETPEPEGKAEGKNQHRFVIQEHDAEKAHKHFDLRLENDNGAMSSWAVPKAKLPSGSEKVLAVKTEDHPISYNKFEGEIPKGEYGAGKVKIHDSGKYEEIEWSTNKIIFILKGKKEKGTYQLIKTDDKKWLLMTKKEE